MGAGPVCFDPADFQAIPMAAFATGSRGQIVAWNAAAADLLCIPAQRALGASCAALIDGRTMRGESVCSRPCPLVQQLSAWMGGAARGGHRDRHAPWTGPPAAHPNLVVERGDGSRMSLTVLGFPALLDGAPVLVHLLRAG